MEVLRQRQRQGQKVKTCFFKLFFHAVKFFVMNIFRIVAFDISNRFLIDKASQGVDV